MKNHLEDIKEIRQMMERSSRFISLSGSSGIIIGLLTLVFVGAYLFRFDTSIFEAPDMNNYSRSGYYIYQLSFLLLMSSLLISALFTVRRTRKLGLPIWNLSTRNMMISLLLPLIAGAFMIIPDIFNHGKHFFSYTLVFYGLGLFSCSRYTHRELGMLGLLQVILGLCCAYFSGYTLFFWTLGFGVLHIFYGALMYFRHER